MIRLLMLLAVALFLLPLDAGPARAEVFPCSEDGVLAAVDAANLANDPGPHALDCAPGAALVMRSVPSITHDLALDGRGVRIDCGPLTRLSCGSLFRVTAELLSYSPRVYGDAPTVTLENFVITGRAFAIRAEGGADLTLRRIDLRIGPTSSSRFPGQVNLSYSGLELGSGPLDEIPRTRVAVEESRIDGPSYIYAYVDFAMERSVAQRTLSVGERSTAEIVNSTVFGAINVGTMTFVHSTLLDWIEDPMPLGAPFRAPAYYNLGTYADPDDPFGFRRFVYPTGNATFINSIVSGYCITDEPRPLTEEEAATVPPRGENRSLGGNVESPADRCGFDRPNDLVSVAEADLGLGPFMSHGGPTPTVSLSPTSVAVDFGVAEGCREWDQRRVRRGDPNGTTCDAGAYEVELAALTAGAAVATVPVLGAPGAALLTLTIAGLSMRTARSSRTRTRSPL